MISAPEERETRARGVQTEDRRLIHYWGEPSFQLPNAVLKGFSNRDKNKTEVQVKNCKHVKTPFSLENTAKKGFCCWYFKLKKKKKRFLVSPELKDYLFIYFYIYI